MEPFPIAALILTVPPVTPAQVPSAAQLSSLRLHDGYFTVILSTIDGISPYKGGIAEGCPGKRGLSV